MKKNVAVKRSNARRLDGYGTAMLIFLSVYALLLLGLYVFAAASSLKTEIDFKYDLFGITRITFENYKKVFLDFSYPVSVMGQGTRTLYFEDLLLNSALYAVGCALCSALVPCVTAYCVSKFDYFFSKILMFIVIFTMSTPIIGNTTSEIQVAVRFGLYDSIPGMWFMKCSFLGMYFLIYHGAFKSIPKDYDEAAYLDGAGNFSIFFRIMLPLVKNTVLIIFMLQFVNFWSDYNTPLLYMDTHPTLALALLNYGELLDTSTPMLFAACIMVCLPSLILFASFKDKFMSNLQLGGIKG